MRQIIFKKTLKGIKNLHHINHSKNLNEFFFNLQMYILHLRIEKVCIL